MGGRGRQAQQGNRGARQRARQHATRHFTLRRCNGAHAGRGWAGRRQACTCSCSAGAAHSCKHRAACQRGQRAAQHGRRETRREGGKEGRTLTLCAARRSVRRMTSHQLGMKGAASAFAMPSTKWSMVCKEGRLGCRAARISRRARWGDPQAAQGAWEGERCEHPASPPHHHPPRGSRWRRESPPDAAHSADLANTLPAER